MIDNDNVTPTNEWVSTGIPQQMIGFGERLREERARLGLTQAAMAQAAAVTANTQANYEKGARNPDAAYLAAVAAIGVDVLYVVTGRRTPQEEGALSVREQKMVYTFRELSEADKKSVQRLSAALKESPPGEDEDNGNGANGAA